MISIFNLEKSPPYEKFQKLYDDAIKLKQPSIEAICISSYSKNLSLVDSRFVNLKYVRENEWIFFSNYNSVKAMQFDEHNQISACMYWHKTDTQIRLKAKIKKSDKNFSDNHYIKREISKNALAHSSNQSKIINSYDDVKNKYAKCLNDENLLIKRPEYWGGYSFVPYQIEFWVGNPNRLNYREMHEMVDESWTKTILEP